MLFADIALAARIERAECRLLADCGAAAGRRHDSRAFVRELTGGVATYTGSDSPFNKLAGLGFAGAIDEALLAETERAFADRGTPVQAEVASLADPSVCRLLTRHGYVLQNFEDVLGLRLPAASPPPAGAGIDVSVADETHHEAWLDVITITRPGSDYVGRGRTDRSHWKTCHSIPAREAAAVSLREPRLRTRSAAGAAGCGWRGAVRVSPRGNSFGRPSR